MLYYGYNYDRIFTIFELAIVMDDTRSEINKGSPQATATAIAIATGYVYNYSLPTDNVTVVIRA